MFLKKCTCCKEPVTTKSAVYAGRAAYRGKGILWFSCSTCKSTMIIKRAIGPGVITANSEVSVIKKVS